MSPELRKLAVQGMVTAMRNRAAELIREYEKIRQCVDSVMARGKNRDSPLATAAREVLVELDTINHAGKLNKFHADISSLLEDISATPPTDNFSHFVARLQRIENDAAHHFGTVIPALYEKLSNARNVSRQRFELN